MKMKVTKFKLKRRKYENRTISINGVEA